MIADCETCERKQVPCKSCEESQQAICYRCDADIDDPYCEAPTFILQSCREAKRCLHIVPGCICEGDPTQ